MASPGQGSEQVRQAQDFRLVVNSIPTLAWSAHSDGSADFFNQRWLDYTGLSAEQARDWGWTVALHSSGPLTQTLQNHEKELIEAALAESKGKVAGPNGAAAKLGIHRSTLEMKIKQLNIKKYSFR
jgi:DNA-binding NtrC family response regulator